MKEGGELFLWWERFLIEKLNKGKWHDNYQENKLRVDGGENLKEQKWIYEYNYGMDVIEIALRRTTYKSAPTFEYINNLITDWYDRGLKTASEVLEFLEKKLKKKV